MGCSRQSRFLERIGFNWSDQPSGRTLNDVSPAACEVARRYLRESNGDEAGTNLADADLLRRLNLVRDSQHLTNAGSLLFVETPWPGVDYVRRDMPGGDSTLRIEGAGPLLTQVYEVERAGEVSNRVTHVAEGFACGRIRAIPPRTLREAIVNGGVHRDWLSPRPTTIEHIGNTLTVTSPGGFLGGVTPDNIITHPAVPRYRSLSETMAALGLAEREGIGVDRMVRDMLAIGRPAPVISEIDGPYVRVVLLGGDPDAVTAAPVAAIAPPRAGSVDSLLLIERLIRHGWVDADTAAPVLQRSSRTEAEEAIRRLADAHLDTGGSASVIAGVQGVPPDHPPAFRLSDAARGRLAHRLALFRTPEGREALVREWCRARGRVSSTEAADLTGLSRVSAGKLLAALADSGHIAGSRPKRKGRGFFYVPANPAEWQRRPPAWWRSCSSRRRPRLARRAQAAPRAEDPCAGIAWVQSRVCFRPKNRKICRVSYRVLEDWLTARALRGCANNEFTLFWTNSLRKRRIFTDRLADLFSLHEGIYRFVRLL